MSFKFNTEQKIYDLAGAKIGGQPGENPTFLIGSIFWLGQKMVTDANKGIFDAKAAEQIINTCQTQSDITGVKFALDIVGTTEAAFEKYIDFVPKHTDAPLHARCNESKDPYGSSIISQKDGSFRQMSLQLSLQRRNRC